MFREDERHERAIRRSPGRSFRGTFRKWSDADSIGQSLQVVEMLGAARALKDLDLSKLIKLLEYLNFIFKSLISLDHL